MKVHPGDLIIGLLMVSITILGALLAQHALDLEMNVFGVSLVGFAVLFLLGQVRRYFTASAKLRAMGQRHG